MTAREYTLVEIFRDPRMLICEASELRQDGHYYLYRYNRQEQNFYRATVPSGAASIHFRVLQETDRIPLGGWQVIETINLSRCHLKVVTKNETHTFYSSTNHQ